MKQFKFMDQGCTTYFTKCGLFEFQYGKATEISYPVNMVYYSVLHEVCLNEEEEAVVTFIYLN